MSLFIASLNSGSNGNCYYVGNAAEAVLIDAGISCREVEKRMARIGLSMASVKALFISHEHTDHISGVPVLAKKHQLPVYVTPGTRFIGRQLLDQRTIFPFVAYQAIQIGDLTVTAFPKFHDAGDPHSFVVSCNGVKVGVITDIGSACEHVVKNFAECHAAFLEANYDTDMLMNGRYPWHLKKRISGGRGHISNAQALELFRNYKPQHMSHLLLAHLSKDNNDPELVKTLFAQHAGETEIVIASRYRETDVYHITGKASTQTKKAERRNVVPDVQPVQYSLF